jgi:dextranase
MPNATEIRGAFKNNTFITTMHIPAGITIINDDSFMNTTKLKFINFHGNALTKLGVQAFRNSAITSLELPDNIVEVGPFAFAAMPSLTSVKLPARLKNIPNGMFELDMKLNNVI